MIARIARVVDRLLIHAYCIAGVLMVYAYVSDEFSYHGVMFQIAQAQAKAIINLASRLSGA